MGEVDREFAEGIEALMNGANMSRVLGKDGNADSLIDISGKLATLFSKEVDPGTVEKLRNALTDLDVEALAIGQETDMKNLSELLLNIEG